MDSKMNLLNTKLYMKESILYLLYYIRCLVTADLKDQLS